MSLSQCPQCCRSISDTDEACPHCGYIIAFSTAYACPYCQSKNIQRASPYGNHHYRAKYGLLGRIFGERAWKCGGCGRKFD